ncbi:MAG TPA: hypothetical protein VGX76_13405, partial [Pirellulales bacterium]|nr:hypothetical protein [Pirellulales bacterium]
MATDTRQLGQSRHRVGLLPELDVGVSPKGQLGVAVSGQALCHAGMNTASRKVRDERVPQTVKINNLPVAVYVSQKGGPLTLGLGLRRAAVVNPDGSRGGQVATDHIGHIVGPRQFERRRF